MSWAKKSYKKQTIKTCAKGRFSGQCQG